MTQDPMALMDGLEAKSPRLGTPRCLHVFFEGSVDALWTASTPGNPSTPLHTSRPALPVSSSDTPKLAPGQVASLNSAPRQLEMSFGVSDSGRPDK